VKKLLGLLATGVLVASPAFAQKVTVSATPASAKAGDTVNICATADGDVKGVASYGLTFTLPAGLTVANAGKFTAGALASGGGTLIIPNANTPGQYVVGIVGTTDSDGPGQIGCFDATVGASQATGDIALAVDASNANGDSKTLGTTGATLTIDGGTTPPPTGDIKGVTLTATPATVDKGGTIKVCAEAGADVLNVASYGLTVTLPAGFTVADSGKFTAGALASGGGTLIIPNANTPGQYVVGIVGTADASGPGEIGCFNLVAGDAAVSGNLGLTVDASNANGDSVTLAPTGVAITVNGGTTPPVTVPHDVNGDGKVDVTDVKGAISVLFGTDTDATHKTQADFNGDGKVDLVDIRLLLQAVVAG
jgi:hypothetical protein